MQQNDRQLALKACEGDHDAFEQLFHKFENAIYRFACYLTKDNHLAEEVYQETWVRVARSFSQKKRVTNFKSWLFTIASNVYKDELRRARLRRTFLLDEKTREDDHSEETIDRLYRSDKDEVNFEINEAVATAVSALTPKQRTVFSLCIIEGFKILETAKMLDIAEGTVKSILHRAVVKLRKRIEKRIIS